MGAPERRVQVRELTRDEVVALLKIEEAYGAARGGDAESSILRGGFGPVMKQTVIKQANAIIRCKKSHDVMVDGPGRLCEERNNRGVVVDEHSFIW